MSHKTVARGNKKATLWSGLMICIYYGNLVAPVGFETIPEKFDQDGNVIDDAQQVEIIEEYYTESNAFYSVKV